MTKMGFALRVLVLWAAVLALTLLLFVNLPGDIADIPSEDMTRGVILIAVVVIWSGAVCGASLLTWRWSGRGKPKRL
jgi:hypothetical protein